MLFSTEQRSYIDFREILKQRSDGVVAWVGAGLSAPAKMPQWDRLKRVLESALLNKAMNCPDPEESGRMKALHKCSVDADSPWDSFSVLKNALGKETYRAEIRNALGGADTVRVPNAYKRLWGLGISGVINLNIDRLAQRAFNEEFPGRLLHDFIGSDVNDYIHLLKSPNPWLANLHGVLDNAASWVFTSNELVFLSELAGYRTFVESCFATRTLLFVGISADDRAAGGLLTKLCSLGVDCGNHFWITTRADAKTNDWAERSGIRQIYYEDPDGSHRALKDIFDDLGAYVPRDDAAPPVVPRHLTDEMTGELPKPEALEKLPSQQIRDILNSAAVALLNTDDDAARKRFDMFTTEYAEAIHRAWFISTTAPKNQVFDYILLKREAEGAFGTVYRASDKGSTKNYAVKILHERIREDRERLHSFRRGVRSMRILTENNVPGVVPFLDASEIPAMVVMEFVEGSTLTEAVKTGVLTGWHDLL